MRDNWRKWSSRHDDHPATDEPSVPAAGEDHLALARESLRELLDDDRVPASVRESLAEDYRQVQAMLEKLEHGHIHIAVFGRVSVGKSATLNALLGEPRFRTSPLHGETRGADLARWRQYDAGGVFLVDTPGINEVDGEARERLAHEVAERSDLVLFVVDGDLTRSELDALRLLAGYRRPLLLLLNKADRYTQEERALLLQTLEQRSAGLVAPGNILAIAAEPGERVYLQVDAAGRETEVVRRPPAEIEKLRERLWLVLEQEGKSLAALNATLFAGRLSDQVAERILATRRTLADSLVRTYCISKGVAVALNPLPVADLVAAAAIDIGMVVHLSRLHRLPMSRSQAGALVRTVIGQMALLMGTTWAVHLASSALKLGTGGLSTVITAAAQGAVAYYSTYVVGQVAERYLAQGLSWGAGGPKRVVRDILANLDRDSLLAQARSDILARLRAG